LSVHTFTTTQVADMTGLSMRQLDYWAQNAIFVPSIQQAHGSGTRKLYSLDDVIQLRSLRKLICSRWSTQKLRQAISMLREVMHDSNPLRYASLISDKRTLLAVYKTKAGERVLLDALCSGGQQVMSLVIEVVEEETRQLLRDFDEQDGSDG
jgi:DNA-binding transcriptional MerR regulator